MVDILEDVPVCTLLNHMSMSIKERPNNMPLRKSCLHWAPMNQLLSELLKAWRHTPVSAVALCLWARRDDLAYELICRVAAMWPSCGQRLWALQWQAIGR